MQPHTDALGGDSLFAKIRDRLMAFFQGNELDRLSPEQLAEIAADLEVQAGDLYEMMNARDANNPKAYEMMQRFGLTPEALGGLSSPVLRDVVRVCHYCSEKSRCERELHNGTAREHAAEFCPNEQIFSAAKPDASA